MTAAEFLAIPEEALYELINGEFIVNTANDTRHQRVLLRVMRELMQYCKEHRDGEAIVGPLDVVLSEDTVVEPDGLLILNDRASIIGEKFIDGAPDLIVEVTAERTRHRDEVVKRDIYDRCGVGEYWLIDSVRDVVTIYRRAGAAFTQIENGGALTSPLLPGFSLDIADVFPS